MSVRRTGFDLKTSGLYWAKLSDNDTMQIEDLGIVNPETDNQVEIDNDETTVSVDDKAVIVKRFYLPPGDEETLRERLIFEISQSLLNPETDYSYEFLPISGSELYLGLAYRIKDLTGRYDKLNALFECQFDKLIFMSRAIALGRGYLNFCKQISAEPVCLVEIDETEISVCLIYQKQLIDLGWLHLKKISSDEKPNPFRLVSELKTYISFRLSNLTHLRLTVPQTGLLLFGTGVDDELLKIASGHFPSGVFSPSFREGLFSENINKNDHNLVDWLTAIGLLAN